MSDPDWKKKIEAHFERESEGKERRRRQQEDRVNAQKLDVHRKKFKCCICGKGSEKPFTYLEDNFLEMVNWSRPGDMTECQICRQWVHREGECSHLWEDDGGRHFICREDANKILAREKKKSQKPKWWPF